MPVVARRRAASTRKAEEESHSGALWATTRTQRGAAWAAHTPSDFGWSALAMRATPADRPGDQQQDEEQTERNKSDDRGRNR
jgi:hypothetical protein